MRFWRKRTRSAVPGRSVIPQGEQFRPVAIRAEPRIVELWRQVRWGNRRQEVLRAHNRCDGR
jgi:hypothetical protein